MKRRWLLGCLSAGLLLIAASAQAQSDMWFGFHTGVRRGPVADFGWQSAPRVVMVRDVYVVDDPNLDDDVFRYNGGWYRMHEGYWYQGRNWGGPWRAVDVRYVPRMVLSVPRDRWRHHPLGGPPGQMKRGWDHDGWDRGHGNGHGHGHGHDDYNGHGNGHGKGHGDDH